MYVTEVEGVASFKFRRLAMLAVYLMLAILMISAKTPAAVTAAPAP